MQKIALNILVIFTLTILPVEGQIVTVKSAFSKDSVLLGEQLGYKITAKVTDDVALQFPDYGDTISQEIEILSDLGKDTVFIDDKLEITATYSVTSFSPGWNTIPPQPVYFQKGELADTVYTTALLLTVLSPDIDTTQTFKPIKPPINTPVNFAELWPWISGAVLLVIVIFFIVRWFRRYYRKLKNPDAIIEVPNEPPHVEAFRELDRLRNEKLYQKGEVKAFYTQLTQIVRNYINRQFGFHAMESTTREIMDAFKLQNTGPDDLNKMLEELLLLADLVKFAKEDPLIKENEMHFTNAEIFVDKTYRMFEEEDEEDEAKMEKNDVEPIRLEEKDE